MSTFFRMLVTILCLLCATQAQAQETVDRYTATNIVSNVVGQTENGDSSLVNPWGMANDPAGGPWWVADEGKGRTTVYSGAGLSYPGLAPLVVTIPLTPGAVGDYSAPTGIVFNGTADFRLNPAVPSQFIFVTRDGSIAGWNSELDRYKAVLVVDNAPQASYTGATIASADGRHVLYAANFGQRRVDAFGPDNFSPYPLREGAFIDPALPDGFSPYNVSAINNEIWITFAMIGTDERRELTGQGLGYVDVFDANGNLLMRLEYGPWLDAPWGIALAPDIGFGEYSGSVLVGNSGSGRIAAFDVISGSFIGFLKDGKNEPIVIPDLHGLGFGNGGLAGSATALYYTAGSAARLNLFGLITPGSAPGSGTITPQQY
jgi:uncharacterized protein (TIGR03118 family)